MKRLFSLFILSLKKSGFQIYVKSDVNIQKQLENPFVFY